MNYMGNGPMYQSNSYGYNAAQDRLDMLERQNYNNSGNQNMNGGKQVQMGMFKGRPVSNFYEANASLIDLDGSLHIFPDLANNRIYTKKITLDGTADLKTYVLTDNPVDELRGSQPKEQQNSYGMNGDNVVGRQEFESYIRSIDERMSYFMGRVEGILGGFVNGKQYGSNDATVPTNVSDVPVGREPAGNATNNAEGIRGQSVVSESTGNGKRKE